MNTKRWDNVAALWFAYGEIDRIISDVTAARTNNDHDKLAQSKLALQAQKKAVTEKMNDLKQAFADMETKVNERLQLADQAMEEPGSTLFGNLFGAQVRRRRRSSWALAPYAAFMRVHKRPGKKAEVMRWWASRR